MAIQEILEGNAKLVMNIPKIISRQMPVFFNPIMQTNRDIAVLVLKASSKKAMRIIDPLAGTGIRGIRFSKELLGQSIALIVLNDKDPRAFQEMKKNVRKNSIKNKVIRITCQDANQAMRSGSWDYIDIDPFGSPNPFLDAGVISLRSRGILALTATDTAPLAGSAAKACMRKYWAVSRNDAQKHEWGLRILIRKAQLIAAQYERALVPLLSYWNLHYYRVYFEFVPGKTKVDEILAKHVLVDNLGPMWTGELGSLSFVQKVALIAVHEPCRKATLSLLGKLCKETGISTVGFFDLHVMAKERKWKNIPPINHVIDRLMQQKYKAAQSHLTQAGIKTNASKDVVIRIIEKN